MLSLGVTVAASDSLVPLLLNRDNPLVMTPDSVRGSWVLAWTGIPQYPYRPQGQMLHQLNRMEEHGWTVLIERGRGLNSSTARGRATHDTRADEMTLRWQRSRGAGTPFWSQVELLPEGIPPQSTTSPLATVAHDVFWIVAVRSPGRSEGSGTLTQMVPAGS